MQLALPALSADCGSVLVLCGDTPLLTPALLSAFMEEFRQSHASAAVLTSFLPDPHGYGRILRDELGQLQAIVEEKDATDAQKEVCEVNTGIYCFAKEQLAQVLGSLKNDNAHGEYYLTDAIAALREQGLPVLAVGPAPTEEIMGVNDRLQLAVAGKLLQNHVNSYWLKSGVTILDPSTTYIDADVIIGTDTVLEPQTYLRAGATIGRHCQIGVGTEISGSRLGDGVKTSHAIINDSDIGDHCDIGPFTYIRPGTRLAARVKAGYCVELKKADIGAGSKVPHLSYVGDAVLGRDVNVGCGTVTCNYDGEHKHTTVIGDEAFIGSNTNFVAPVSVGARAVTGAGSTITKDVPARALAVERAEQKNIPDWAERTKRSAAAPNL